MSRRSVERIFTSVVIRLFDTATEPHHRGQLYSRTMADVILKKFGLSMFLNRFLGFLIEAVVEPMRLASSKTLSSKRRNANIVRMKSQSFHTLMTSDLLRSQSYNSPDGQEMSSNLGATLSYSLGMSEHSYNDLDKDFSSSEDSDDELADCSLMAKFSGGGGGEGEPREGKQVEGMSLSPLVMAAVSASKVSSSGVAGPGAGGGAAEVELRSDEVDLPDGSAIVITKQEPKVEGNSSSITHSPLLSSLSASSNPPPVDPHADSNLLASFHDSISMTASAQYDQSLTSFVSEDSLSGNNRFTNSLPSKHRGDQEKNNMEERSLPLKMKLGLPLKSSNYNNCYVSSGSSGRGLMGDQEVDGQREEERDGGGEDEVDSSRVDGDNLSLYDPELLAVNLHVSEVAADCLCWLFRRLGPLLSSKHIVWPLVEGLHRCFTGVLGLRGKELAALKCLISFAECYGEIIIREMYVPHAENMVRCSCTMSL